MLVRREGTGFHIAIDSLLVFDLDADEGMTLLYKILGTLTPEQLFRVRNVIATTLTGCFEE